MINPNKSPYHGQFVSILMLILPPLVLVGLFYMVFYISKFQSTAELNWVSSKIFGCGLGIIFHLSCWLMSAFKKDLLVVINRIKDFFSNLFLSPKHAFIWYFDDIKENGVAFWIDLSLMLANAWIFVYSIFEYIAIMDHF